jgi:nicotinate-nucleotide adenylyltransferase
MVIQKKNLSIAILGGSFDPIHQGHIELARSARNALKLDKVIFIPSYRSPFKKRKIDMIACHRLAMVRLAVRSLSWAEVSDIEIRRKGLSYTFQTVKALRKRYGSQCDLFLILGSDAFSSFRRWKRYPEILSRVQLAVAHRGDRRPSSALPYLLIPMKKTPISSSLIRMKRKKSLKNLSQWLAPSVTQYIDSHHLYA